MAESTICFITGFPRSGTTLVERLIGNQKDAFVAHQLFPTLLINLKKEFLKEAGNLRSYPFIPYPSSKERIEFNAYLESKQISELEYKTWMLEGTDYPAMGEKATLKTLPQLSGSLNNVISSQLRNMSFSSDQLVGFKDVMMDEFIPYFEKQDFKNLVVVRDPRAVIASLINSSEMGEYRPTLYNLQLWKRMLRNARASNAHVLKYEDLVSNSDDTLKALSNYLGKEVSIEVFPLRNNKGEDWNGNSSFKQLDQLSSHGVDGYKNKLSNKAITYIESICKQEMGTLGYTISKASNLIDILSLEDPFEITHRNFLDWDNKSELALEVARM